MDDQEDRDRLVRLANAMASDYASIVSRYVSIMNGCHLDANGHLVKDSPGWQPSDEAEFSEWMEKDP